jgi:hypothetical protein
MEGNMRRVGILILILSTWFASAAWLQPHTQERTEIIIFDPPGTGTGPGQGSVAEAINPAGAIVGYYLDASGVNHGFLRDQDGAFTTFDVSGAGTGLFQGTFGLAINPAGAIVGFDIVDATGLSHSFLRTVEHPERD